MKRKLFAILMTLTLVLTYIPAIAFADDGESAVYDADFSGSAPTFFYQEYDRGIKSVGEDASITVHTKDGDLKCTFYWNEDDYIYDLKDSDGNLLEYWIYIEESTVSMEIYGPDWVANIDFDNVTVDNDVKKIVYETKLPISLYSEDIITTSDDGDKYYDLCKRTKHSKDGATWTSPFCVGDKIIVYYSDNTTETYVDMDINWSKYGPDEGIEDAFVLNGSEASIESGIVIWPDFASGLEAGNNTVTLSYHGRTTKFNVFVETPESRAKAKAAAEAAARAKAEAAAKAKAAAEEAARQGVPDSSIPKVKASKPATKKATVTAKWKKLNKKQLKKSKATHYEVWICENKGFAKGLTKEKIVKKGKASVKFTGLKKNTKYYVQVRAIKYVNGVKHVGKWSQKKIKTKKK